MTFPSKEYAKAPQGDEFDTWLSDFVPPQMVTIDGHQYPYEALAEITGRGQGGHEPHDVMRIRLYGAEYLKAVVRAFEAPALEFVDSPADILDEDEALARLRAMQTAPANLSEYDADAIAHERARIEAAIMHNLPLAEYRTQCIENGMPYDEYGATAMPSAADIALDESFVPNQPLTA